MRTPVGAAAAAAAAVSAVDACGRLSALLLLLLLWLLLRSLRWTQAIACGRWLGQRWSVCLVQFKFGAQLAAVLTTVHGQLWVAQTSLAC
jgi:hypothetical protein